MVVINKLLILLLVLFGLHSVKCHVTMPKLLRECYTSNIQIPLSLHVLIDIIRKVEKHTYTTFDMKTLSASLLRRFKFDGVEYHDVLESDGVFPYSATGSQRIKNKLIEEVVPGNAELFPISLLTKAEQCALHFAISNTVAEHKLPYSGRACQQVEQTEKLTGRTMGGGTWDCPREQGVILTSYGTVSLGVVIETIAAALQRQTVAVNELIAVLKDANTTITQDMDYNEDEVDFIMPKELMLTGRSMWFRSLLSSSKKLDNIWLTSIAGELAEMVIYQGPLLGADMALGAAGFWNNTMRPIIYYLIGSIKHFDATRAELMAGVDALVIASNLETWIQDFYSLRLSQILDMYYSDRGVTFNANIKACERKNNFLHAVPNTILNEQTYAIAQLLAYRKSIAYISPTALQRLVKYAVEKFSFYAQRHLLADLPCYKHSHKPRVEALIVFDGAWSKEYTTDFLAVLIQDLDVSMYGSKMGIIDGTTGNWVLNTTNSPSFGLEAIQRFSNISWPTQFNYTKSLETILTYLNGVWQEKRNDHVIGNLGQVVILLIPLAYMSNKEKQSAMSLLQELKRQHPDVHFLYYTSRYNSQLFHSFVTTDEDYLIDTSNIDGIIKYLRTIPRVLRPIIYMTKNESRDNIPEFEDYVSPSESITYRLHPHWRKNIKKLVITINSFGYGTINICTWNQFKFNGAKIGIYCTELSGHKVISLTDPYKCMDDTICPNTYYSIHNVTSLYKCAEIDCKTPDQVRFIIRTETIYYNNSQSRRNVTNTEYLFLLVLQFILAKFMS